MPLLHTRVACTPPSLRHSLQYTPLPRLPPLRLLGTLLLVLLGILLQWLNELILPKLRPRRTGMIGGRAGLNSNVDDCLIILPAAPSIVIRLSLRRDTHSSIVVLDWPTLGAVVMEVEKVSVLDIPCICCCSSLFSSRLRRTTSLTGPQTIQLPSVQSR